MQFPGFWVDGRGSEVSVRSYAFDETELSSHSNWTQAYQNEDPNEPAGFLDPAQTLQEVAQRVLASDDGAQSVEMAQARLASGDPLHIGTTQELAMLILATLRTSTGSNGQDR